MDSAVGIPQELAEKEWDELTPMIKQYVELCEKYDSELLLFHVGDFYKAFGEAAETVGRICELNLTTREDNSGEYTMAGLRVENAETHLKKLLEAGYRVAIADQVEDPDAVSGVAERAVTRVITPGTLTEEELLQPGEHNYVASLTRNPAKTTETGEDADDFGLAFLDVSTGAFFASSLTTRAALQDELSRISPVEVLLGPELRDDETFRDAVFAKLDCDLTDFRADAFETADARERVVTYFGQLQAATCNDSVVRASGALLAFAEYTRGGQQDRLEHITTLTRYDPTEYMQLDDVALRGLELFERRAEQSPEGATLVEVIDETVSALGSRRLREWLRRPLVSVEKIESRLDAVEELLTEEFTRRAVRDLLEHVYDIERLTSRITRRRATARDLRSLAETLAVLPDLRDELRGTEAGLLVRFDEAAPTVTDIQETIDDAIKEEPAAELTEGGIIKEGYSDELDELRRTVAENREWIEGLEAAERERTGIDNLRVGHTEVHGYYIEVTESNLDKVPDDYTRRQTLKQAERFYTPELQEREEEIIAAHQRAHDLEYELFTEVREQVAGEAKRLQTVADELAALDALASFAEVSAFNDYSRPDIGLPGSGIEIRSGRHPVVEQTQERFVPNDTVLDADTFLAVITGPNMSGKSTYLRQVALITILAQSGCFVPATEANIGVVDRVFTRIGASDDITGGRSTFMMEMTEVADILAEATDHSLVLLDEVGRGTSTADGYALACAVTQYIHEEIGAFTLFATHHHDLTRYISQFDKAANFHFSAEQQGDEVIFQYNIDSGPATASYGVEVALEAELPMEVIDDAKRILDTTDPEAGELADEGDAKSAEPDLANTESQAWERRPGKETELDPELQAVLEEYNASTVTSLVRRIEQLDIEKTTPLEALNTLQDVQRALRRD